MLQMLFAGVLFLGTHLGISSTSMRGRLVATLGQTGYLLVYSLLALVTLSYLIWLYGELPRHPYLWLPDPSLYMVPKIVMPFAMVFLLGGFMVRNPTTVGMEGSLKGDGAAQGLARGVTRITRHPFQWSVVLWAGSHLVANGDQVSVVFFSTFLVLGLLGGLLIDRKKAALGADWQQYAEVTSNVPFLAILSGRNRLVIGELIAPGLVGLVGYGAVFWGHYWIAGVRLY